MGKVTRLLLAGAGLLSWAAGAVAAFVSSNNNGTAALILMGALASAFALIGHWPTRISISGNEMSWEDVREAIDSQIEVAEIDGEPSSARAELTVLRHRLESLQRTGTIPKHPAEVYDEDIIAALNRVVPGSSTSKMEPRNRSVPDFELTGPDGSLYIETKWRQDPSAPYAGTTLRPLLNHMAAGSKLLVVVNAAADSIDEAAHVIGQIMGSNGRVTAWLSPIDDGKLASSIQELLSS